MYKFDPKGLNADTPAGCIPTQLKILPFFIFPITMPIRKNVMYLPPYPVFPTIFSERIMLREVTPADLDDILEISVYDGKPAASTAEALEMLQRIEQDYLNGETVHWGIADKVSNVMMGTCGYYRGFQAETGELGCVLRPAFRGKGIMTEAMQAAIDFGFRQIGLKQIIASTSQHNIKAVAVLERLFFKKVAADQDCPATLQTVFSNLEKDQVLYFLPTPGEV